MIKKGSVELHRLEAVARTLFLSLVLVKKSFGVKKRRGERKSGDGKRTPLVDRKTQDTSKSVRARKTRKKDCQVPHFNARAAPHTGVKNRGER